MDYRSDISIMMIVISLCFLACSCKNRQSVSSSDSMSISNDATSVVEGEENSKMMTPTSILEPSNTPGQTNSKMTANTSALSSSKAQKENSSYMTSTVNSGTREDSQSMTATSSTPKKAPIYNKPIHQVEIAAVSKRKTFVASDGTKLPYRLHIPDGYTESAAYPVILFLHGAGERGTDNERQLNLAVPNLYKNNDSVIHSAIGIFPQCPEGNQWVDTPWTDNYSVKNVPESNELNAVVELLEEIQRKYSVDNQRIYGFGISMGGYGVWDLLMRHPGLLTAGVPLCGGGDASYASQLAKTPIWTIHSEDDTVVPVKCTLEMVQAIQQVNGNQLKSEIVSGYGHNVWDYAAGKQDLIQWLFSQKKSNS